MSDYMDAAFEKIIKVFPTLNCNQKRAIVTTEGPLLIIAGPGTGKTLVLILRTLYLLLSKKANPSDIILTTFTEKAAFELRDRIYQISKKLDLKLSMHEMKIGTIHSICNGFISKFLLYTPLKGNYVILDELTQYLFLFEHFDEIIGEPQNDRYFKRWSSKWRAIKGIVSYINKITEEAVDPEKILKSKDPFLRKISEIYCKYQKIMYKKNKVDFAHLQRILLNLLINPEISTNIKGKIKYLMVDEYQDTNFIQEQIFFELVNPQYNICVVGDEDQSLYRFRGATVRNILEFPKKIRKCKKIKLLINYRSHEKIIESYNKFMNSVDWSSEDNKLFRFPNKKIIPYKKEPFPDYPAVFCIWTLNHKEEAERILNMIKYLKENRIIEDYSDIAILLGSVRLKYTKNYIDALKKYGIPYFCPRAKAYFENDEIKTMLACLCLIFGFYDEHLTNFRWKHYLEEGLLLLKDHLATSLTDYIRRKISQIASLTEGKSLNLNLTDYFYQLLAYIPFSEFVKDENKARNLAIFSQLLNVFQLYYHISIVSYANKDIIKFHLFNSFFRLLMDGGIDEYEDPENPLPKGFIQIMTIHQSKGLEFPVVIVGSLDKIFRVQKRVDKELSPFYRRGSYEPMDRITEFDRARHFYVAFSRTQKLLVLTSSTEPQEYFLPIWEGLDQWPYVKKKTLKAQKFVSKPQFIPKKSFSITSHINIYETCPRQYLFYKYYSFNPSRAGRVIFGLLVHQTIEDIHRLIIDEKKDEITDISIEELFEENYKALLATGLRSLAPTTKESALKQVFNYYNQNGDLIERVIETEIDVSVEKEDYIILGKIDLLIGNNNKFEILDFKTQPKPDIDDPILQRYLKQLSLYAYIMKERYGKSPERLLLYWTSEERRENALMEFKYDEKFVEEVGKQFDEVIKKILHKNFEIHNPPNIKICKECDFRYYCSKEGIIKYKED